MCLFVYPHCLCFQYTDSDLMTQEDQANVPLLALHQMHKDLQSRRKCFSGTQLAEWIMRNADLFLSPDELSLCGGVSNIGMDGAESIAQQLLDLQVIVDVQTDGEPVKEEEERVWEEKGKGVS